MSVALPIFSHKPILECYLHLQLTLCNAHIIIDWFLENVMKLKRLSYISFIYLLMTSEWSFKKG